MPRPAFGLRGLALGALAAAAVSGAACSKKKEDKPRDVPPPLGAASVDELTTKIGVGSGLDAQLASSSTRWERVFVAGPRSAVIAGSTPTERVLLLTDDGGRTFRALREPRRDFSSLALSAEGVLALASGSREEPPKSSKAPPLLRADGVRLTDEARTVFRPSIPWSAPDVGAAKKSASPEGGFVEGAVAALGPGAAALLTEDPRRRGVLRLVGGGEPAGAIPLPPSERIVPMPYGRPPALLSIRGTALLVRPLPSPGEALAAPKKVDGFAATPEARAALSRPPCEAAGTSAALVPQAGGKASIVLASGAGARAFPLPAGPAYLPEIGCAEGAVLALRTGPSGIDAVRCDLEGKCAAATTPAFRGWPGPHDRALSSAPTPKGAVVALARRAGERWELAVSHSTDDFKTFDLPRVVAEGTTARGRVDLGALVALEGRLLLLVSADVTGTTRRGLYALASDDGGLSWGPP